MHSMNKKNKKRTCVEKLVNFKEARFFDSRFWNRQSIQSRFAATWKAIDEFYKMRGINGHKLRLQRTIEAIRKA